MAGRLPERPNFEQNFSFDGTLNNAGSYANAIYYVIFSYGGYYNLQKVTDELKDPIKNLPRCGVSALGLTTVLYLLANVGNVHLADSLESFAPLFTHYFFL
jgi:amino acid transporter